MPRWQSPQVWVGRVTAKGALPTAEMDKGRKGSLSSWNWASTHILHSEGLLLQPLHSQDVLNGDATEGLITCNKEGGRVVFICTACPKVGGSLWPRDGKATAEGSWLSFPEGWKNRKNMDVGLGWTWGSQRTVPMQRKDLGPFHSGDKVSQEHGLPHLQHYSILSQFRSRAGQDCSALSLQQEPSTVRC